MSYLIQLAAAFGAMFAVAPYWKDTPFNTGICYIALGVSVAWICAQIGARMGRGTKNNG